MRVAIEDQIHEFATLPDYDNINSKPVNSLFSPELEYVITF